MSTKNSFESWQVLHSEVVYKQRLTIVKERLLKPSGEEMDYTFVSTKGAAAVLAFTDPDHVILTRQYRHPIRKELFDLPAGGILVGESPQDAAIRELSEETGFTAKIMEPLGVMHPAPGLMSQLVFVFCAKELIAGETKLDENEVIDRVVVRWSDLLEKVLSAEGIDGTLAFAVLLYAIRNSKFS